MPNERLLSGKRVSRRDFLFNAAVGSGAIIGAGLLSSPASAAGKMSQKAVNYQKTPKGNQQCDNCFLWQGPSSCKLVEGTIAPSGWCVLYKPKK